MSQFKDEILRHRLKQLVEVCIANKWKSQNLNPCNLAPGPVHLTTCPYVSCYTSTYLTSLL